MRLKRTIRNCADEFRFVCPRRWDGLAPTADPSIRDLERRERGIDRALREMRWARRDCPGCGYPISNLKDACRGCGRFAGRAPSVE